MVARRAHAPKRRYRSVQFVCHSEIDREGMYTESARHSSWAEDAKYDFVVKLVQAQQGSCKWRYPIRKCSFRDFPSDFLVKYRIYQAVPIPCSSSLALIIE